MNQLQPEPISLRTGAIDLSRLRQFCQLSPAKRFPPCPHPPREGRVGVGRDCLKINYAQMGLGSLAERMKFMQETANERLVRGIARDIALEAMKRIRARLREVEAAPVVERRYEAEWGANGKAWPTTSMMAELWVPYLLEDLAHAEAEFERCRH